MPSALKLPLAANKLAARGRLEARLFCVVGPSAGTNARTLAQKLLNHYSKEDPSHVTEQKLHKMLADLPGMDGEKMKLVVTSSVAAHWRDLYEASLMDDLLDSEFETEKLRPDLQRRNEEDLEVMFQAGRPSPKDAKAQRFEDVEKARAEEETALLQTFYEKACEGVEQDAAKKIAAITADADGRVQRVKNELAKKREDIIAELKRNAAATDWKKKVPTQPEKPKPLISKRSKGRRRWLDEHPPEKS